MINYLRILKQHIYPLIIYLIYPKLPNWLITKIKSLLILFRRVILNFLKLKLNLL